MAARRVLVTGVSRDLGGRLAQILSADPAVQQVVGVDTVPPPGDIGRAQFVRADIRNPLIAKVIATSAIDTVVHMNVLATPVGAGGRAAMKETNVIGTMQLLAACQKAASVRTLVVKSTAAVYGTSPRDPALFTEDTEPRALPRSGYAKDAVEVEGYVRGFARRRPDVAVTVLRFTNFIGPDFDSTLSRYFGLPVAPTVFGFDPRLQLCHADDALAVLQLAVGGARPGVFNVAGDGVLLLSQALRRLGRLSIPVLPPAVSLTGRVFRRFGMADFSPEQMGFFEHGRCLDTTALRDKFGYAPRYTTAEAFEDYARRRPGPLRSASLAAAAHA
ncbi:MAG TPA: NAD-dependent epimerase/dehydratase family protein [Mycobacteriales bacterium]|jgi:UDP-glucose 4-epimerase|nr:NAD-dependent epimerase/dehydratase family protein [Mycobacteriales bacterium]